MSVSGVQPVAEGITNPPIDDLLTKTDPPAKLTRSSTVCSPRRGEGLPEYVGPLVDTHVQEKPLSIALREIADDLLTCEDIDPDEVAAEALAAATAQPPTPAADPVVE